MTDKNHTQAIQQAPKSNPVLRQLAVLVGVWQTEISLPSEPSNVIRGQTTFEWLEEGPFLIARGSVERPEFPTGIQIIGGDESTGAYSMLYFDSRGVARIYQMILSNEVWKLWREAPDFPQRFTGKISDDGNTISGAWEQSSDGSNWELDFNLTYKKVK